MKNIQSQFDGMVADIRKEIIQSVIDFLKAGGTTTKRRGRPRKTEAENVPDWVNQGATARTPKKKRKGRTYTAAQRKAAGERMKARWAARKKADKKMAKTKAAGA